MPTPRIVPAARAALGLLGLLQALGASAQNAGAAADAADIATLRTRSLAAQCAQCHGTDGRPAPGAEVPALAGLPAAALVEQMKAFRAGTRPSTVMQQLAKGFSDAQIEQLARYFAAAGKP
jgi:sulfide dehydrogenase cytochrome subunit